MKTAGDILDEIKEDIELFLRRKYVVRKNRGIDYIEAGVDDLAAEMTSFVQSNRTLREYLR